MEHMPFGVFNPRFYGVSLFVGQDRLDVHDRYESTTDLSSWMIGANMAPISDVSTVSAVDHEVRHFHDFLLSPLGTVTMGLRMQASINGLQTMKVMQRCSGRFVPVPLTRWIEWDAAARQRWIDSTGSFFGIERIDDIIDLAHAADVLHVKLKVGASDVSDSLSPEAKLNIYALGAAQAYASMAMWRKQQVMQYDMDVSADDVFEGAAHLVQLQAVWTGQGEAAAQSFLQFVRTSSAKHLAPLQLFWRVLQQSSSHSVGIQRLTELFTWMLLGSSEQLNSNGHPANRYFQILELAALAPGNEIFVGAMSTSELFDVLDELTKSSPWKDNLASASASADRKNTLYSSVAKKLHYDALFAVASVWHSDQLSMRETFLSDPESLAHPLRYLSDNRFPAPFVETRLGWMLHERDAPLNLPNHRVIAADAEGKRIISYISAFPGKPDQDLDNVLSARVLTHMIDFLFSDEPVLDLYEHWCRSQIEGAIGKKLVSVY